MDSGEADSAGAGLPASGRISRTAKDKKGQRKEIKMKNRSKILMAILPVLACFALSPQAQADDEDLGGGNSGAGFNALFNLSSGGFNTALGWFSQFSLTTGSFNTAVGGGSLDLNNGDSNTAVGAAALLLNTTGTENTAIGTD